MGHLNGTSSRRLCVAILSARETPEVLARTLDAVVSAVGSQHAAVDVLVNGNPRTAAALAAHVRAHTPAPSSTSVRVWRLALRDKAHAWNTYVHALWPGDATACFMDGCITVSSEALASLQARLDVSTHALVAAAVPTVGGSAAAIRALMHTHPQIHGSLYAVRQEALERVRRSGLQVPLGFYRSDSLLGTLFNFNLDPARHDWDDRRIAVTGDATWTMPLKSPWKPGDVSAQLRRVTRQALGRLEEAAIKERFYDRREPATTLTVAPLAFVDDWMRLVPDSPHRALTRSWLARARMAHLRRRSDWGLAAEPPVCLVQS